MAADFCPHGRCDGSGWVLTDEGAARPCECRAERVAGARARAMGSRVPKRYLREASFDRPEVRDLDPVVLRHVRTFTRSIESNVRAGRGLWLFGEETGTGKTLLAMLISKAALDAGLTVAIYSVPYLLARIKETYEDGSGGSYMDLFERLRTVDLLHLDDLGAERRTDWVIEQLYSIVNQRWEDERSIVVTSNADFDELREQLGSRTVSRLFGICGDPIPMHGPDWRVRHDAGALEEPPPAAS